MNAASRVAQRKKALCLRKRWKYKRQNGEAIIFRDISEKTISWAQRSKDIDDIAMQYNPGHAALLVPCAGVQFLLEVNSFPLSPGVLLISFRLR